MINKIIKEQLNKLKVAQTLNVNETTFLIPKYKEFKLGIGKDYIIEVDDIILNPSSNDLLCCNWNNNSKPNHKYLRIHVNKTLSKMINVTSNAFDATNNKCLNQFWDGWLPLGKIKVIKEL